MLDGFEVLDNRVGKALILWLFNAKANVTINALNNFIIVDIKLSIAVLKMFNPPSL